MSASFTAADAIIKFSSGIDINWDIFEIPIPEHVVVYATDDQVFKTGDGIQLYKDLPDGPSIAGAKARVNDKPVFTHLSLADNDHIIVPLNGHYVASATTIADIYARIQQIISEMTLYDANLAAITQRMTAAKSSISNSDNSKFVIVQDHQLTPGVLPNSLRTVKTSPPVTIRSVKAYSDKACKVPQAQFAYDSTYYIKVSASHDNLDIDLLNYTLTDDNTYTKITHEGRGLFRIDVAEDPTDGYIHYTATASYGQNSATEGFSVALLGFVEPPIHIDSILTYADYACTIPVANLKADTTYYAMIKASFDPTDISNIVWTLQENTGLVNITEIYLGKFKLDVGEPVDTIASTLTATATHKTVTNVSSTVVTLIEYIPVITVGYLGLFSDSGCTQAVTQFAPDSTYYVKINATFGNLHIDKVTFNLWDVNDDTTITHVADNIFRVAVAEPYDVITITINGSCTYRSASATGGVAVQLLQYIPPINISSIGVYSDVGCTNAVTQFEADTVYYARLHTTYGNLAISRVTFNLTSNIADVVVAHVVNDVFKLTVGEALVAETVTLVGTAVFVTSNSNNSIIVPVPQYLPPIVVSGVSVYTDAGCTNPAGNLAADTSYFVRVNATYGNLKRTQITWGLTSSNGYVTVASNLGQGIFQVNVSEPANAGTTTFSATAVYSSVSGGGSSVVGVQQYIPPMWITSVDIFSDAACTAHISSMSADSTYYVRVQASYGNLTIDKISFGMTSDNGYAPIVAALGNGVFQVNVSRPGVAYNVTFTGYATYSTTTVGSGAVVYLNAYVPPVPHYNMIVSQYYDGAERFYDCAIQANGCIIAVGQTYTGYNNALVALAVRFDSNLNVVRRMKEDVSWDGGDYSCFNAVCVNGDEIYAVGYMTFPAESWWNGELGEWQTMSQRRAAYIVYFGPGLDVYTTRHIGLSDGAGNWCDNFYDVSVGGGSVVAIGGSNIVRLDGNCNVMYANSIGNGGCQSVYINPNNGYVYLGFISWIQVRNIALQILRTIYLNASQYYSPYTHMSGDGWDGDGVVLTALTMDASGYLYAVGCLASSFNAYTYDCGTCAIIMKFDGSLNIIATKQFDTGIWWGHDFGSFYGVKADAWGRINCVGQVEVDKSGIFNGIYMRLNTNLDVEVWKRYGHNYGTNDSLNGVCCDGSGNVFSAGRINSCGTVIKLPPQLAGGTAYASAFDTYLIDRGFNVMGMYGFWSQDRGMDEYPSGPVNPDEDTRASYVSYDSHGYSDVGYSPSLQYVQVT